MNATVLRWSGGLLALPLTFLLGCTDAQPLHAAGDPAVLEPEPDGSAVDALVDAAAPGGGDAPGEGDGPAPADSGPDAGPDGELLPMDAGGDAAADAGGADTDSGAESDAAPPLPTKKEALAALKQSVLPLNPGWKFQVDPGDQGTAQGYYGIDFDDGAWTAIDAGETWEQQGFPEYDGVAWYRKTVEIPAGWEGSPVRLSASGVDDEYDLYVNGEFVRHYGSAPDHSVWNWQTHSDLDGFLLYGGKNVIAIRVVDWGFGGGIWRDIAIRRSLPLEPYRALLPEPVIDSRPEWVALYWAAWQMAWDKVAFGTPQNGFSEAYMDEGFNEQIYQWDSCFICLFGRYGLRLFPVMATLDNFYSKQRTDGYIQRVYSETDGGEVGAPTPEEPLVNPPLFAWVEWDYYRFSGDSSRLSSVLPKLESYFQWLEEHARAPAGKGLYYQTDLGSGMDNMPRGDVWQAGWADMSAQQALAALYLGKMAAVLGTSASATAWQAKHSAIAQLANQLLWSPEDGFYYDLLQSGVHSGVRHVGGLWTLLAEIADTAKAAALVGHLEDQQEFARPHRFPVLAASDPSYDPKGHYWRGSVWAPTNYMIVRGLRHAGHADLARAAAENHIARIAEVYAKPPTDEALIAPEEQDGDYATIWECYGSEAAAAPATRWDAKYYSRQDFVGWSGLGPIAMLIEDVLGFDVLGAEGKVVWRLVRTDRHGLTRLPLAAGNIVSLIARERPSPGAPAQIDAAAESPFTLEVWLSGKGPKVFTVPAGESLIDVSP